MLLVIYPAVARRFLLSLTIIWAGPVIPLISITFMTLSRHLVIQQQSTKQLDHSEWSWVLEYTAAHCRNSFLLAKVEGLPSWNTWRSFMTDLWKVKAQPLYAVTGSYSSWWDFIRLLLHIIYILLFLKASPGHRILSVYRACKTCTPLLKKSLTEY